MCRALRRHQFRSQYFQRPLHRKRPTSNSSRKRSRQQGCYGLTFNSPTIGGPAITANEVALVDIDDCGAVTFNSPSFGIYPIASSAPLTFSGGGCSTEPKAIAIPGSSGVIGAVTLTYPGAGCSAAPAVTINGDSIYAGSYFATGSLQYTGTGNQHYASYVNSAGAAVVLSFVPPVYP